jgi:DNA polymerase III epsilon subunit-like protein
MLLFLDTETTGLPKKKIASFNKQSAWPRMVELAWIECNLDGTLVNEHDFIIKPDSYSIPKTASAIHGITTEQAQKKGTSLISALVQFQKSLNNCSSIIGHNIDFDLNVIKAEFYRTGMPLPRSMPKRKCTMKSSVRFCNLKRGAGRKNPSLEELHYILFGLPIPDSHTALNDARACMRCYFELKQRGIV